MQARCSCPGHHPSAAAPSRPHTDPVHRQCPSKQRPSRRTKADSRASLMQLFGVLCLLFSVRPLHSPSTLWNARQATRKYSLRRTTTVTTSDRQQDKTSQPTSRASRAAWAIRASTSSNRTCANCHTQPGKPGSSGRMRIRGPSREQGTG